RVSLADSFFCGPVNCSRLRGNVPPPTHVPGGAGNVRFAHCARGSHCALGALFCVNIFIRNKTCGNRR
ncbi:MAG: hypothetical protein FWF77_00865, partial [Defluviitaleaceae bacterium]|nr:hypothetical protein [Defluviitaleaceae bacterium]